MTHLPQHQSALSFDQWLGDPRHAANTLSYTAAVELDELEEVPFSIFDKLFEWGLHHYLIPANYGGKLTSFEEMTNLLRVLARRDGSSTLGFGLATFIGSISVWVAGSDIQKTRLAQLLLDRKPVSALFTEEDHGNDWISYETVAMPTSDSYIVNGSKWLIANIPSASGFTLFAKTDPADNARSFSIFFIERSRLEKHMISGLPRLKTHGMRACHVSGVKLNAARISTADVVGDIGQGVEIALRAFQVTRTLIPSVSLGALDTALRVTLDFARNRQLYGDSVYAIPHARRALTESFVDLLICDCVATSSIRALHAVPEQMSAWSCISKAFVSEYGHSLLSNLATVLGARFYLREGLQAGIFQKILRDYPAIILGHGSRVICLSTLVTQLRNLLRIRPDKDGRTERLRLAFDLSAELPPFDGKRLRVFHNGAIDLFSSLDQLPTMLAKTRASTEIKAYLSIQIERISTEFHAMPTKIDHLASLYPHQTVSKVPEMFDLATRYCELHAALSCLFVWLFNYKHLTGGLANGAWLVIAVERLVRCQLTSKQSQSYIDIVSEYLLSLHDNNQLFSITPISIATHYKTAL